MSQVRELQHGDIPVMRSLWHSVMPQRCANQVLHEKTFGAVDFRPDLLLGAFEGSQLVGFGCGTLDEKLGIGGLRIILVDPVKRGRGIGSEILLDLEGRLQNFSALSVIRAIGIAGNYFTPGVDPFDMEFTCFLERWGYRWVGTTQNLIADVGGQRNYSRLFLELRTAGYQFRRVGIDDEETLRQFIAITFPIWKQEVDRALYNVPATVHICLIRNEVVGFASSESNNVGMGTLGPTGVRPDHRKRGIGSAVLHLCVDDLRSKGFEKYVVTWTHPKLNCLIKREFGATRRELFWLYEKRMTEAPALSI